MQMIEPHVGPLLWFAGLWAIASVGFYVLAGAFPLETRPDLRALRGGRTLVAVDVLLLLVLAAGSLAYGLANLRWTSLVIVAGLGLLFAPSLFHLWPERWRDGLAGLLIVLVGFGAALGVLAAVGHLV